MTETDHLIALIGMAIMTILVLTIGTLAAADLLGREKKTEEPKRNDEASTGGEHSRAA